MLRVRWFSSALGAMLLALAALTLGIAALGAWGPARRPVPDDLLVVASDGDPKSLDPHVTTALGDFRVLVNLYEGLVRFKPGTLEIEPSLARSFSVSENGLSYRFELRHGVRFHDGSPFDAEAVKWNLERLIDPRHPYADTGPFPLSFFFDSVRKVRAPAPDQVVIELSEPFAPLLSNLAYPTGLMVSPTAVARHRRAFGQHPSGTGPFRLSQWRPGEALELVRFDGYWGDPARLPRVTFRPIADPMTRLSELRAETVDLAAELPADALGWFRKDPGFEVHDAVGPHLWFLILNLHAGPLSDVRVRRAVNLSIDKRALCHDVLSGTAQVASGPVPAAFGWAADPDLLPYPHDPPRARELLAQAGYDGRELTLIVPDGGSGMLDPRSMATAIQADLKRVGVPVRIESYEWQTYLTKVNAGLGPEVSMAAMAWMTNDPDTLPYLTLRSGAVPPAGFNSGYYRSPEVDAWLERARRASDQGERAELYRRVARRVHEDAPWVVVGSWTQSIVTRRAVRGFRAEPSFFLLLSGADKG